MQREAALEKAETKKEPLLNLIPIPIPTFILTPNLLSVQPVT